MNYYIKYLAYLLFVSLLFQTKSSAQGQFTTQGKDFRLAFGSNVGRSTSDIEMQLRFVAPKATVVTISYTLGGSQTINLTAGQVYTHTLSIADKNKVYNPNNVTNSNNSMRITSTEEIAVFAINMSANTTDATNVMPVTNYGTDYYHINYDVGTPGFIVIANENSTLVYLDGVLQTTLSIGQVYVQYSVTTGRKITTSKPVAFFAINSCTQVPSGAGYCDCLFQQLAPISQWGNYFLVPVTGKAAADGRNKDRVRVLASQNATTVTYVGGTLITGSTSLNAGQWLELEIYQSQNGSYITANKPIAVTSFLMGSSNFSVSNIDKKGDPAMAWIPPVEQKVANIAMAPFIKEGKSVLAYHYATVLAPTPYKNLTTMKIGNGAVTALTGGTWSDNAASGYSYYDMALDQGNLTYVFENSKGMTILGYGFGPDESYYYLAAASARQLDPAYYVNDIHFQDMNGQSYCNGPFTFKTSIQYPLSSAAGFLKWYIDGVEYVAARDQHNWTMPVNGLLGTHTIKLTITDSYNNTKDVITSFTVVTIPLQPTGITAATICSGTQPIINIANTIVGLTYKVYNSSNTLVGTGAGTGGAINITCSPAITVASTYTVVAVNGTGCVSPAASVNVGITNRPTIPAVSASTACYGKNPVITLASSVLGVTYNIYSTATGGSLLGSTAGTGSAINITINSNPITNTTYHIEGAIGSCLSSARTPVTVTVYANLTSGTISINQTICYNSTPTVFTVTAPTGATGVYTYQWEISTDNVNWTAIAGATAASYTETNNIIVTTYYRRKVMSGTCDPVYSTPLMVSVYDLLNGGTIATNQNFCFGGGDPLAFTSVSPASGGAILSYQWQKSVDNINWTAVTPAATGLTYNAPAVTTTTYFRRQVMSTGGCGTENSNAVMVKVYDKLLGGTIAADQNFCFGGGDPIAFTNVSSASGGATISYQWQKSVDNVNWTAVTPAATGLTYDAPAVTVTTYFRRQVTSAGGCGVENSNTVTVTVYPKIIVAASPTDQTCYQSNDGKLNVIGSNGLAPYTYSIDGGSTWSSASLFENLLIGAYGVIAKDNRECKSDMLTVHVSQPLDIALSTTTNNVTCFGGNSGAINASATGGTPNYQFRINGGTWTSSGAFSGLVIGSYTIDVKDNHNCTKSTTVTITQPAELLLPTNISAPTACPNLTAEIEVANSISGATYRVYDAATGGTLQGTAFGNGGSLTIYVGVFPANKTLYVEVTSGGCTSTRKAITIEVRPTLANYPDIRLQVCPTPNRPLNLSSFLDTTDYKSVNWTAVTSFSPPLLDAAGSLQTSALTATGTHVYTYSIANTCYPEAKVRKVYILPMGNKQVGKQVDTVAICKDFAEGINLRQILGLAAGGEWTYDATIALFVRRASNYPFSNALILEGDKAYTDPALQAPAYRKRYKTDANAIHLDFIYTTTGAGSCLGAGTRRLVVVITSTIL